VTGSVVDTVGALASFFRVPVSPAQCGLVERFYDLLLTWNQRINLTGARSLDDLLSEHLPDSFALSCLVPAGSSVADVGSGGGLPALPFALLRPDAGVTLFESRAKRQAFLRTAVRELDIRSATVAGRFTPAVSGHGRFDLACSRATFPPDEWLGLARGIVRGGGRVVVFDALSSTDLGADRLVASVEYRTGRGHQRRAAAYSFDSNP
jgi:16S rRNA (guanine527-N7)-methyltransferase